MASPRGRIGDEAAEVGLVAILKQMIEDAARSHLRDALQERDEATRACLDERLRRVEERLAAVERRQRPRSPRDESEEMVEQESPREPGDGDHALLEERLQRLEARLAAVEEGQGQGALERRMGALEEAVQRALATVFPRVEALVAQLEETSPLQPTTPSSPSGQLTAEEVEERERERVEQRMREVKARKERAEAKPSRLGEDLSVAVFYRRLHDVRQLLDAGADINYVCRDGSTPLTAAFFVPNVYVEPDPNVLFTLLARGADVNAIDSHGCTALHYAAYTDCGRSVEQLLGAGASVDAREQEGSTPLHWAASHGKAGAVGVLLAAGANKSIRCWSGDWDGKTALDVARSKAVRDLLRS